MADSIGYEDYIQNGLIFMLDASNLGGVTGHWLDLIGSKDFVLYGSYSKVGKGIHFNDGDYGRCETMINVSSNNFTAEFCCEILHSTIDSKRAKFLVNDAQVGTYPNLGVLYRTNDANIISASYGGGIGAKVTTLPNGKFTVSQNKDRTIYNINETYTNNNTASWTTSNTQKMYLGNFSAAANHLPFTIYCIRIYNRRLSADEMQYNQAIDNKRFNIGL